MMLKRFWAWFLLLAVAIQWVGGVVYIRLSYTALIELEMNEVEALIAARVEQEYGVRAKVKILDEDAGNSPAHSGYGAPFIFSHQDDDSTDYFTVESDWTQEITSEQPANTPIDARDAGQALLSLNQLFSPYIITTVSAEKPVHFSGSSSGNFAYHSLKDLYHLQVPTPPPSLLI